MASCIIYFTPWDTFVVRREKLACGVFASCDPVVRLSPDPWPLTLGLAAWRVMHGRTRVASGAVGRLGASMRRFAQAVDHARRIEVNVENGVATVVPCQRTLAGLFQPVSERATTGSSSPLAMGRSILMVASALEAVVRKPEITGHESPGSGGDGADGVGKGTKVAGTVKLPADASLILARGATPDDLAESLGMSFTPRRRRHAARQQREIVRRLSIGHSDGWLLATPVESVDAGDDGLIPLLEHLSRHGTAIYLAAHDEARYYAWALATEGRIERVFGTDASTGDVLVDLGQRWQFEPPTEDLTGLTAESVRAMAREWAFDPWSANFTRLHAEDGYRAEAA
jgi:hypothetical protein